VRLSDNQALSWKPKGPDSAGETACGTLENRMLSLVGKAVSPASAADLLYMLPYLKLKLLAESVSDQRRVHFANVAGLQEVINEKSSL